MNKTLVALTAACAAAAPAHAQSSVTLYGLADAGINYVSGQDAANTRLSSGIMEGSRWGLRGTEELGSGYKALFVLESRVELDTGSQTNRPASGGQLPDRFDFTAAQFGVPPMFQPGVQGLLNGINANIGQTVGVNLDGRLFDRQAFVGLITPVGAVLAGRQYTPGYEMFYVFDAMETQSSLSVAQIATLPPAIDIRKDNALAYRVEKNGFVGTVQLGFGEQAGSFSDSRYLGANFYYRGPQWGAGIAYATNNNSEGERALRNLVVGAYLPLGPGRLSALVGTAKDQNPEGAVGVRAALGALVPAPLAALVPVIGEAYASAFRQDLRIYHLGWRVGSGPHTLTVAYNHLDDRERDDADIASYGAVYTYALSKRTDVNFVLTRFQNDDNAQVAPGGNGFFGGVTSAAGDDAHNVALSLRHRF